MEDIARGVHLLMFALAMPAVEVTVVQLPGLEKLTVEITEVPLALG